jgi:hypothetical protein
MFVRRANLAMLLLLGACRLGRDTPWPAEPLVTTASPTAAAAPNEVRTAETAAPIASPAAESPAPRARDVEGLELGAELPSTWPPVELPAVRAPWCADGLTTLDESSCYILPAAPTRTLLIYLHGIVPPRDESPEKSKVQGVILKAAQRAGVVALVPRGRPGFGRSGAAAGSAGPRRIRFTRSTPPISSVSLPPPRRSSRR